MSPALAKVLTALCVSTLVTLGVLGTLALYLVAAPQIAVENTKKAPAGGQ